MQKNGVLPAGCQGVLALLFPPLQVDIIEGNSVCVNAEKQDVLHRYVRFAGQLLQKVLGAGGHSYVEGQ